MFVPVVVVFDEDVLRLWSRPLMLTIKSARILSSSACGSCVGGVTSADVEPGDAILS